MQAFSSLQKHDSISMALGNAVHECSEALDAAPDAVLLFASGSSVESHAEALLEHVRQAYPNASILGGITDSVIGTNSECEDRTCVSLMAISGMSSPPRLFPLECVQTPDGWSVLGLDDDIVYGDAAGGGLCVVACPRSFSMERLYDRFDPSWSSQSTRVKILGGNLSRAPWNQPATLFCDQQVIRGGAVAMVLPPELEWQCVLSQGCRPIGEKMVVTGSEGNVVTSLGGKPALLRLRETFNELPNREREMAMRLLLIGTALSEYSETFSHGEFLIRNIVGIDQDTGAIHCAEPIRVGQTIRFHVVDADAADADLRQLVSRAAKTLEPIAGLLVSCNGRGTRLFNAPHHDAGVLHEYFPSLPLTGFLAAGEFGPVAEKNFVHGFTAVASLLCRKTSKQRP